MRNTFATVCSSIIRENKNSALLLGDIGVYGFREVLSEHSNRVINVGILEQSMIGIAAGMSSQGIIPTVHTIAPFIVNRAYEQIKLDFAYQNLPGNLVSVGASFDYAALGCTHHCPEDITTLMNVPGINLFIPGTSEEFKQLFLENWNNGQLNYFRLSESQNSESYFDPHNSYIQIKNGSSATVVVVGPILDEVKKAVAEMNVNFLYFNKISNEFARDIETICPSGKLIIIEPFYSGAIFQYFAESLSKKKIRVLQLGVPRVFLRNYGKYSEHLQKLGLDSNGIKTKIQRFLND